MIGIAQQEACILEEKGESWSQTTRGQKRYYVLYSVLLQWDRGSVWLDIPPERCL